MADITQLILDEHEWFRGRFAALDELQGQDPLNVEELRAAWQPLADRLDVHAVAEERIFYPHLLRLGAQDPRAETLDAIGDHNDIRDGVHDAGRLPVGTAEWWSAVGRTRAANDEHMAEEEREGLSDFRQNAPLGLREALGAQFADFLAGHRTTAGLDVSDKNPQGYVREVERGLAGRPGDGSLGIGSLRRR